MRILDRYLLREFTLAFLAVMAFVTLILLVAQVFDKFDELMTNDTPIPMAMRYFFARMVSDLVQAIPMAATLGVLFSVGNLARNNEVLAMMTSGVHGLRLAVPIVFAGIVIFIGTIFISERIAPPLREYATYLEMRYLEGRSESRINTRRDVFTRGSGNRTYTMRRYLAKDGIMESPSIVDVSPDFSGLARRINADRAKFVRDDEPNKRSEWLLTNAQIWEFDDAGSVSQYRAIPGEQSVFLEYQIGAALAQTKKPEEMNFFELRDYIATLRQRNQPVEEALVDLTLKLTFPIGILFIMLIGFSYAVRSRAGTAITMIGYGVSWAFAYYAITAVLRALGKNGTIFPVAAGIIPLIFFVVLTVIYIRKSYQWYN